MNLRSPEVSVEVAFQIKGHLESLSKTGSRRELTWQISLENYLHKTPAGLSQSVFLVGKSLHNDMDFTPELSDARFPHTPIRPGEGAARRIVFVTDVDAG